MFMNFSKSRYYFFIFQCFLATNSNFCSNWSWKFVFVFLEYVLWEKFISLRLRHGDQIAHVHPLLQIASSYWTSVIYSYPDYFSFLYFDFCQFGSSHHIFELNLYFRWNFFNEAILILILEFSSMKLLFSDFFKFFMFLIFDEAVGL